MKITNANQFDKLVEEMQKNPSFAKGFRRGTVPNNYKDYWEHIATVLNALGPPRRSADGWQKVWRDFKFKTKRKWLAKETAKKECEGAETKHLILNPLEKSMANLLNFENQIQLENADQKFQYQDQIIDYEIVKTEEMSDIDDVDWKDVRQSSESEPKDIPYIGNFEQNINCPPLEHEPNIATTSASCKKNFKRKRIQKIKKNCNQYEMIMSSSVKESLQDMNEYRKELLEIETKKLQLAVERNEREKEMHEAILKIKSVELAIREKELQLYNKYLE